MLETTLWQRKQWRLIQATATGSDMPSALGLVLFAFPVEISLSALVHCFIFLSDMSPVAVWLSLQCLRFVPDQQKTDWPHHGRHRSRRAITITNDVATMTTKNK